MSPQTRNYFGLSSVASSTSQDDSSERSQFDRKPNGGAETTRVLPFGDKPARYLCGSDRIAAEKIESPRRQRAREDREDKARDDKARDDRAREDIGPRRQSPRQQRVRDDILSNPSFFVECSGLFFILLLPLCLLNVRVVRVSVRLSVRLTSLFLSLPPSLPPSLSLSLAHQHFAGPATTACKQSNDDDLVSGGGAGADGIAANVCVRRLFLRHLLVGPRGTQDAVRKRLFGTRPI
jgi:hypothetical protein